MRADPKPGQRLAADEHVPGDRHLRDHGRVLVDGLDAAGHGLLRRPELDLLALDEDPAAVRRMGAGEHLDQGRLAGAVVADEPHDLAGLGMEVDVDERMHAAVPLLQALAADQRVGARLDEAVPGQHVLLEDLGHRPRS
jgi:hypothetical protein